MILAQDIIYIEVWRVFKRVTSHGSNKGIKVTSNNITLMSANKNPTIKITLQNGTSLIKFGASQAEFESLKSSGYTEIDVIGTCAINEWQGMITPQILIKDYEVVGKQDYYF